MKLLALYFTFFHFGLLCFGGGYVLTPIYIDELVNGRGWMTLAEFSDLLAITQITPGPVSINAATFFGYRQAGILGTFAATAGMLTPSLILLTLALHSIRRWSGSRLIKGLMWGVGPATIGLMAAVVVVFAEHSIFDGPIPWTTFFNAVTLNTQAGPELVRFRPLAAVICAGTAYALSRTRIKITTLVLLSALIGAALFPLMGN